MGLLFEIVAMWIAVTCYAVACVACVAGALLGSERLLAAGTIVTAVGATAQVASIVTRWLRVLHGPALGFYEVVSSYALFAILAYLGLSLWNPRLRPVGAVLLPVAFLMIGGAMLAPKGASGITSTLASWWLVIHVLFANLSAGALVAAFAFSGTYVLRERKTGGVFERVSRSMPDQDTLDDLAFRFVAIGFVFLGVMIATGAIWANEAWGSYWSWDPIETWSLIAWLVYAGVLHLRLVLGWKGRRFAIATMLALPVVLFTLLGVPVAFHSIHGAYIKGTG